MHMRTIFFATLIAVLLLAACSAANELAGTSWTLISLNGQPTLPNTRPTLRLEGDRLSGSDGCNSFSGSYSASGRSFRLTGPLASTMMACEEPLMNQASAYLAALSQAASYTLENGQLTLLDGAGKALAVFVSVPD